MEYRRIDMFEINNVNLIGRLTRDPELKYTQDRKPFVKMNIANNPLSDKKSVIFINASLWGERAEKLHPFLKKGKQLAITGTLQQNRWEDKNGNKKEQIEIWVQNLQLLGGKNEPDTNNSNSNTADNYESAEEIPF